MDGYMNDFIDFKKDFVEPMQNYLFNNENDL